MAAFSLCLCPESYRSPRYVRSSGWAPRSRCRADRRSQAQHRASTLASSAVMCPFWGRTGRAPSVAPAQATSPKPEVAPSDKLPSMSVSWTWWMGLEQRAESPATRAACHLILDGHVLRTVVSRMLPHDLAFLAMCRTRGGRSLPTASPLHALLRCCRWDPYAVLSGEGAANVLGYGLRG
jgi:hypothetical protein